LSDLLKYCGLDTLAMVKIYEFLVKNVLELSKKITDYRKELNINSTFGE